MVRRTDPRDVGTREGLALHCLCRWATQISEKTNAPDSALRTQAPLLLQLVSLSEAGAGVKETSLLPRTDG